MNQLNLFCVVRHVVPTMICNRYHVTKQFPLPVVLLAGERREMACLSWSFMQRIRVHIVSSCLRGSGAEQAFATLYQLDCGCVVPQLFMISYLVSRRGGQVRFVDVVVLIVDAYARIQRLWL